MASARLATPVVLGALLLGVGQQIFVALRNPFLADLGVAAHVIPYVQGTGAAAGVLAGLFAARVTPRLSPRWSFLACAGLQSAGFAIQAAGLGLTAIFAGAAVAGLAIQLHTAVAPPELRASVKPTERVRAFAAWSLALTPAAGIAAALLVQPIVAWAGRGLGTQRALLGFAALVSGLSVLAFARLGDRRRSVDRDDRPQIRDRRRVRILVGFQAFTGLAGGVAVPLLHVHFRLTYGVSIDAIAALHGATMIAGLIGAAIAPALVRRAGHVRALVLLYGLAAPLFIELATTRSLALAIVVFIARNALVHVTLPVAQTLYQELVVQEDAAAVAGYGTTASAFAWAVGSFAAGPLIARGGESFVGPMLVSGLGFAAAALGAALVLPALWRTRSLA